MTIEPCPTCNAPVDILPSHGGRGGEQTAYFARCSNGHKVNHLGMGTKRSAVTEWNRYARAKRSTGDS